MYKTIILTSLISLGLLFIPSCKSTSSMTSGEQPKSASSEIQTQSEKSASNSDEHIFTQKTISERLPNASITADYPSFGIPGIDENIESTVKDSVRHAKEDLSECTPEDDCSFEMNYHINQNNTNNIDIILSYYQFGGGPHGYPWTKTLMYDVKTAQKLSAEDVLKPYPHALEIISNETRKTLCIEDECDLDACIKETEPIPSNFENMIRNDKGIDIFFDHYTLGYDYASGPHEMSFTWEQLDHP